MKFLYAAILSVVSIQVTATAPTVPASNLNFPAVDGGFFNVAWTAGNGARRILVCKAGSPVTFIPQNGVDYAENTTFGNGQQVAPGEFVIYDNAFTSFFLTGLTPATQYFFAAFEYNGTGVNIEYLITNFLTGSASTSAAPTVQTSNVNFPTVTTNSVTVTWTKGNGQRRLVVVRQGGPVTTDPVNSQPYNVNSAFGSGATTGPGNFTVYNGSSTSTVITNLQPATEYHLAFYEFNGSSQPQYKTPAFTGTVTTRSIPTIASTNVVITKTDGQELSLAWTNGNGQRRIIVAKQGSDITSVPANGTDYNANATFGAGPQIGSGEFVVYDDNFNAATITGLNPATVYYFRIFEYDGTGTNTIYLASNFGSVNGSTAISPNLQTVPLQPTSITSSSVHLQFAPGNGRARLVIGRKNAPVNFSPTDLTPYAVNTNLTDGNFVAANTTESHANIQNLDGNTVYHFATFEFNGFNQPLYLVPGAVSAATTLAALPVKLSKWEVNPNNGKVNLEWTTSSEFNAASFHIERSQDAANFSTVTTIPATGNSNADKKYSAVDLSPFAGRSYYRLKIVDIDGKFEYSSVRPVLVTSNQSAIIVQNPVQQSLNFVVSASLLNQSAEWKIINTSGQVIARGIIRSARTETNVSPLAPGRYWLTIHAGNEKQSLSFVKN
jgi:hypothetical protein